MSIRIEQYDGGEVLYLALDPDGVWARSAFPDELVTVDYNAQGGLIGIEVMGSLAKASASALLEALLESDTVGDREEVREALRPAFA